MTESNKHCGHDVLVVHVVYNMRKSTEHHFCVHYTKYAVQCKYKPLRCTSLNEVHNE